MRKTVQILLTASLCGCVAAAPRPDAGGGQRVTPIPISLALEEIITTGVRQHLQDPVSAKFGTMAAGQRTSDGHQEIVICGYVSTTEAHSDGGSFLAKVYPDAGSNFELVAMSGQSPNADLVIDTACRAAGLPLPAAGSKAHA
ncbi:hypothetical protein [Mesorhizobium comanense]|uniref:hypothetical protein n=1 Tax=Mesorhizobium comanense TaxID=2502215 RepID=UPI0010F7D04B|nr:hypothetical protein [Mesorhizobium comanense]